MVDFLTQIYQQHHLNLVLFSSFQVVSDETTSESSSSTSSEIRNSATEISTDSEFAHDDPTPTREIPSIIFNDFHVTKTRGSHQHNAKKIQVTTGYLQKPNGVKASAPTHNSNNKKNTKKDIELKLTPFAAQSNKNPPQSSSAFVTMRNKRPSVAPLKLLLKPRTNNNNNTNGSCIGGGGGYALNRTQSTGGIAAKVSLELKKKYLLGGETNNSSSNIQKSDSVSTLDTKLRSFHTNISDCQRMLLKQSSLLQQNTTILPPPDLTNGTEMAESNNDQATSATTYVFQNEPEDRPRSPVHETSIIVPDIDWTKVGRHEQEQELRKSHSDDSLSVDDNDDDDNPMKFHHFDNIPTVKISDEAIINDRSAEAEVEIKTNQNDDAIALDSLLFGSDSEQKLTGSGEATASPPSTTPMKSITSDRKVLNQPKSLPTLVDILPSDAAIHLNHVSLHQESSGITLKSPSDINNETKSSGRSTPSNDGDSIELNEGGGGEGTTTTTAAALTETELSDWARDGGLVSSTDDFDDVIVEFNLNHHRGNRKPKTIKLFDDDDMKSLTNKNNQDQNVNDRRDHVCGKTNDHNNSELMMISGNLDSIEFMDTETTNSSDGDLVNNQAIINNNNGYVLFKDDDDDDDDLVEDSLNPIINNVVVDTKNEQMVINNNSFGGEVIDLKPSDLVQLMKVAPAAEEEHDEDSLLFVVEATNGGGGGGGTTTEENTCSDSTVKNITISKSLVVDNPVIPTSTGENNFQKQRLEDKLAKLKAEQAHLKEMKKTTPNEQTTSDFHEHCQRLTSKVEFSNVKDSIDVRKSKQQRITNNNNKSEMVASPPKPDLIQEETGRIVSSPIKTCATTTTTPDILYKKGIIEKERDVNQKLIQEMVMNKMKSENKSLERKRRSRNSYDLSKSATTDNVLITEIMNTKNQFDDDHLSNNTPDVLLSSSSSSVATAAFPLQKSQTVASTTSRPMSSFVTDNVCDSTPSLMIDSNDSRFRSDTLSLFSSFSATEPSGTTHNNNNSMDDFQTPKAPPRRAKQYDNEQSAVKRTAEKLKQDARVRARLLSNEELGLSPEDKLLKLREKLALNTPSSSDGGKNKSNNHQTNNIVDIDDINVKESIESLVVNTERRNSWLYSNDTLNRKRTLNNSFRRSKSRDNDNSNNSGGLIVNLSPTSMIIDNDFRTKSQAQLLSVDDDDNDKKNKKNVVMMLKVCQSDPNLLDTDCTNKKLSLSSSSKKKCVNNNNNGSSSNNNNNNKDRVRRKSITKMFTNLFAKKSPQQQQAGGISGAGGAATTTKGLFSKISPKSKNMSKVMKINYIDYNNIMVVVNNIVFHTSFH